MVDQVELRDGASRFGSFRNGSEITGEAANLLPWESLPQATAQARIRATGPMEIESAAERRERRERREFLALLWFAGSAAVLLLSLSWIAVAWSQPLIPEGFWRSPRGEAGACQSSRRMSDATIRHARSSQKAEETRGGA